MATEKEKNDNFNWSQETGSMQAVENDELVCKGCAWATDATDTCQVYKAIKPGAVLYGGGCKYRQGK